MNGYDTVVIVFIISKTQYSLLIYFSYISFSEHHLRKPRQIYTSNARPGSPVSYPGPFPVSVPKPLPINKPLDPQEELMRSERINRGFEKMLQFVTIAGQIDSYLSERAKAFIGRLSRLTEDDDSSNRLQSRRSKCR